MKKIIVTIVVAVLACAAFAHTPKDAEVVALYADNIYNGMAIGCRLASGYDLPVSRRGLLRVASLEFSEAMMSIMHKHGEADNWKKLQTSQELSELNHKCTLVKTQEDLYQINSEVNLLVSSEYPGVYKVLDSQEVEQQLQRLSARCALIMRQ